MSIVRCESGHYYDDSKYHKCPHCGLNLNLVRESQGQNDGELRDSKTVAMSMMFKDDDDSVTQMYADSNQDDIKTQSLIIKETDADPVVGWLVCVSGPGRGRDYRVHSGRNFIGRSPEMDICIAEDGKIVRDNQCSVAYDRLHNIFLLCPGEGTDTYLNGERVMSAVEITKRDKIVFGDTELAFIPFCEEDFKW